MYDLPVPVNPTDPQPTLVDSYKSISKILREGTHTYSQVRMDIDSGGCGYFPSANSTQIPTTSGIYPMSLTCQPPYCAVDQPCYFNGWSACCTTSPASCHDSCNCYCYAAMEGLLSSC